MRTIKNVLLIAFFMLGTSVFAQQNVGPNQNRPAFPGQKPNKGIVSQLNLSNEQKAKLKDIRREYHQKDSAAFSEFRNQQEQKRIEQLNAFKSILNKEQLDQFEKKQQNREYMEVFGGQYRSNRMGFQFRGFMGQNRMNRMAMHFRGNIDQNGPARMGMQNIAQNGIGQGFASNGRDFQRPMVKRLTPEERAKKQTERLTKELNLTEEQATKIQGINLKFAQEGSIQHGEKNKKDIVKGKRTARQKEIKSVLNKDQNEKYETLLEEVQSRTKRPNNER
jgi:Spy/CpxP family protein refolding chaperone